MDKVQSLKEKLKQEKLEEDELDKRIAKELKELEELNEERLEAKMHRIAMEEIRNCSRESSFRSMGYVVSFHGYPDMAKTNHPKDKNE